MNLLPHKSLYQFLLISFNPEPQLIKHYLQFIEDKIESADVAEIMKKIQSVVDESIENTVAEPIQDNGKLIDLSGLDFELLERYLLKTKNKNATVQSLKDKVEKQLKQMVEKIHKGLTFINATRKSLMYITGVRMR